MTLAYIQVLIKRMIEARMFKSRGSVFLYLCIACTDIHTTKYSGDHEILVKNKNAGSGWQLFFKNSGGERVIHSTC